MAPPVATIDTAPAREREADADVARPAPARVRRGIGLEAVFTAVFALAGWWVGIRQLADNSFFWHLRTGEWMLDHGIPHGDIYSYTAPGVHWVAQSWLAELTYGALDRTFGAFAIRLLIAVTGAAITVASYRLARRLTGDRVRAGMLSLVAFLATFAVFSERPLAFGLLAMLVLVWIVEVPDARIARRPLLALPLLFWLWANVHGTFELGVAYVALHLLGRWVEGAVPWRGRERDLVAGTALAMVVSLFNPYGPGMLLFPVQLLGRGQVLARVVEWRSPQFRSPVGIAFAAWLVVLLAAVLLSSKRPTRRDVVVLVPFLLLALWAERNIGDAVLVTLPIAARAVATTRRRGDVRSRVSAVAFALVVALVAVSGLSAAAQPNFQVGAYPDAAMTWMQRHDLVGPRLFTTDAWAGYTILRYWPQQQIFLDDRYDMFPLKVIDDYNTVADGKPDWQQVLDKYHVQVVVWQPQRALSQLLAESAGWRRVYHDHTAVVYERVAPTT